MMLLAVSGTTKGPSTQFWGVVLGKCLLSSTSTRIKQHGQCRTRALEGPQSCSMSRETSWL